jgi:hypothetical protein
MELFRELSEEEVVKFKAWARDNYEPHSQINMAYHPVIQAECALINKEQITKGS